MDENQNQMDADAVAAEKARIKAEQKAAKAEEAARKAAERKAAKEAKDAEELEARRAAKEAKDAEAAQKRAERERIKAEQAAKREQERAARAANKVETEAAATKSVVDQSRYAYAANGIKTESGRKSVDCGDAVATILRGVSTEDVVAMVSLNGAEVNPAWELLNTGLRRMSASNVLRRIHKKEGALRMVDGSLRTGNEPPPAPATEAEPVDEGAAEA